MMRYANSADMRRAAGGNQKLRAKGTELVKTMFGLKPNDVDLDDLLDRLPAKATVADLKKELERVGEKLGLDRIDHHSWW
jgi:hypothetical protein